MRRRNGTGLTANEHLVMAAAARLLLDGTDSLYGYELFARLRSWEGAAPMDHGTLYRCLRSLESRGGFVSAELVVDGRVRVAYSLTRVGRSMALDSVLHLTATEPPSWVDHAMVTRCLASLGQT